MTLLRRRSPGTTAAFYKGVPAVNLLVAQSKRSLVTLGQAGWPMLVRLLLVALMVGGAVVYVLSLQETDRYVSAEAAADQRAAIASDDIDGALTLTEEIEALNARGGDSQDDFDFLKAEPSSLIAAISSAVALEVNGVSVIGVETLGPSNVTVHIMAASHNAAIEWRRLIAGSVGVERVITFDFIDDTQYVYEAQLISGGE